MDASGPKVRKIDFLQHAKPGCTVEVVFNEAAISLFASIPIFDDHS